jgi:hypothetical protein
MAQNEPRISSPRYGKTGLMLSALVTIPFHLRRLLYNASLQEVRIRWFSVVTTNWPLFSNGEGMVAKAVKPTA